MQKVDVIINVYGKPWQTLCALKSLMLHSGEHIDRIWLTEEKFHPYDDAIDEVLTHFDNIIHFKPNDYYFTRGTTNMYDEAFRWGFRYQYGIENSDKKYVFITHNDILYTGDIIGDMLSKVEEYAGIGLIGQCWNCPAFRGGYCDGDRHDTFKPTHEEALDISRRFPPARYHHHEHLNKEQPMPFPECRLNEFACLIDRHITMRECYPNGETPLFGSYDILDLGDAWFRGLFMKGYKFKHYDINGLSDHGHFSRVDIRNYQAGKTFFVSGYPTQLDHNLYLAAESAAKEYFETHFNKL